MDHQSKLAPALKDLIPSHWKSQASSFVTWPDRSVSVGWLEKLIAYRRLRNIPYRQFVGLPMILVSNNGNQRALWKINPQLKPLVQSYHFNSISNELKSFLELIGVYFVVDSEEEIGALVQWGYIDVPNSDTVVIRMQSNERVVFQNYPTRAASLNEEVSRMLSSYQRQLPGLFRDLPLFKTVGGRLVSANNCMVIKKGDLPTEWKDSYGNVVLEESITNQNLIQKLGIKRWTYEDVCKAIFTRTIPSEDILSLSRGILSKLQYNISQSLHSLAEEYVRVKSDCNTLRKPCELFEKTSDLRDIFLGESDRFPDEDYTTSTLKRIGLKSVQHINSNNIKQSIKTVQRIGRQRDRIEKVNAILRIIKQNGLVRSFDYNIAPWIPVQRESPRDYPESMPWFGAQNNNKQNSIKCPSEVFLPSFQYLVGSHKFIVSSAVSDHFRDCFQGTVCVERSIGLPEAIKQLENLQMFYNRNEKAHAESMAKKIYKFINQLNLKRVQNGFPVWHGDGFTTYQKTILINENMIDVSPYIFQPPKFVTELVGRYLKLLGCQTRKFSIYLETLKEIASKNEISDGFFTSDLRDTELALSLVTELAMNFTKEVEINRSSIFVPVECSGLKLAQLDTCHYLDFDSDTKFSTSSSDNIVHRRLSSEVSRQLGIPNFVCRIFQGDENSLFEPWGQHQEPLTKNLQSILEGYEDGMAIVKELIQNADDAGASEVSILYDRRMNEGSKGRLISPQMKEWQGPALWVHNNKMFTEKDFKNITKLNAGTKKSEATKIGKFGLGFNAVYHLTDVPSIMSGKSLVIFDPHMKYLGDAMKRGEPGVRIALHNRVSGIANFSDQFSVFEGVFGAHINLDSKVESQLYEGSLFRFPLRNAHCALTSEIKKLHYSEFEMRKLLAKVEESLDVLLLFTQNVVKFSVYELDASCKDPNDRKLLFSTQRSADHPIKAIVDHANTELQRFPWGRWHAIKEVCSTDEVKLTVTSEKEGASTKKWIVHSRNSSHATYEYASQHPVDGLLPYCSIAFSMGEDGKTAKSVDGHLFCFLPLPIRNGLLAHVNASFKITKDRLSLKYHTEDEKNYYDDQQNWNDLIGTDVGQAYYKVLVYFKERGINFSNFYTLFPAHKDVLSQRFSQICVWELLRLCKEFFLSKMMEAYGRPGTISESLILLCQRVSVIHAFVC